jgi:protein pelota
MIVKTIRDREFLVVPEDSDDLFLLRRIIRKDDLLVFDTTRVIKQVKEFSRPERGERIKVKLALNVKEVSLDSAVDRLLVNGTIINSDSELVPRGSHHSHTIKPGDMLAIEKSKWEEIDLGLLKKGTNVQGFMLVSIDRTEVAVGRVSGTHLQMLSNVYSGFSGKMYRAKEEDIESYFYDITKTLLNIRKENDAILIFGPGEVKRRFHNYLASKHDLGSSMVSLVDGIDIGGQEGIYVFLRSSMLKDVIGSSKIAAVSSLLSELMTRINTNDNRVAMGLKDVYNAAKLRAVESLMFSDAVFTSDNEGMVIDLLNTVETNGGATFALDSSTDIGMQVSSLGGIVALLRYALR